MSNTLVDPPDLAGLPGAPFTQAVVDSAVGTLRGDMGWHIAPAVTETIKVDGSPDKVLVLPTRWLVSVTAVRDVSGAAPVTLTGWRASNPGRGLLYRDEGWPQGFEVIEVDLKHGYADTPAELLPAIAFYCHAQRVDETVSSESLLSWSKTYRSTSGTSPGLVELVLAKFSTRTEN